MFDIFCFLPLSRYPVILSIENHCSVKQQKVMVDHMTSILGDKLFKGKVDLEHGTLPSPEELKHKILIKVCTILDEIHV
ncbi:hypothetical protein DPMN_018337 [Dreissena polymorpha]|uniref:Phosphatidylinositol-specific phospholipase C X domain-containing protein n=1 Tax=Dreissena polymorpha TaxID=45954 RepID=A0A9D4S872_DREPO|nr:hypothetical protein DPMN_018337 [Dreissena polymorpha]